MALVLMGLDRPEPATLTSDLVESAGLPVKGVYVDRIPCPADSRNTRTYRSIFKETFKRCII
jgi:hypothetical protein